MAETTEPDKNEFGVEIADPSRPFFFDLAELPSYTNEEVFSGSEDAEKYFDYFGRALSSKVILSSPELTVIHETAPPGERVKPHRHGTPQLNYVLRGELWYGNRCVGAGMGSFTPNTLYAWRVGDEGAEWLEIHGGLPELFFERS